MLPYHDLDYLVIFQSLFQKVQLRYESGFFFPHIKFGLILKNCLVYVFFLLIWELGLESKRIGSIRGELKFELFIILINIWLFICPSL